MQDNSDPGKDKWYGWVMVFVGFSLSAMSFGGLSTVGVFLKPLIAEFGWSRGGTALGFTVAALSAAVFGLLWGFFADRRPTRRFMLMAAVAMSAALMLLSQMTAQWQYYLFFFLFGAFGHGAVASTAWANIGQWFTANKGLALGVGLAGSAFGQAAVPFIARLLISAYDWQTAYLILGAVYLVLGLAIAALTRDPPAKRARLATIGEGTQTSGAWSLGSAKPTVIWFSVAVIFCCSCMSVAIVHIVPAMSDNGFKPEIAASVLTVVMLAGALGRLSSGKFCDMFGPLQTYATMSLGQTCLVIWFPHVETLFGAYGLAAVFGFFFSGVMASMIISVNVMVPGEVAARSWAVVSLFAWCGMGLGSYMGGALFDLTGSYTWPFAFAFATLMGCGNLIVLLSYGISRNGRRPALA
ncbi:MAG: MFS transporter [Rhodospirillaceae bacterium]|jgi:MFS family permease|nr:MFS transporter [Rhodospirillaceae bacterium]MBT7760609.1 MFS transporter [Rhodospirillaceae bacterium]